MQDSDDLSSLTLSMLGSKQRRKKHLRRTAHEISKEFSCPYSGCTKSFGSEGSLNLHMKIKHNGGTKTERERIAQLLVESYVLTKQLDPAILDTIDLNLPPGLLRLTAEKSEKLKPEQIQEFDETELLECLNRQLAPKFRQMIVDN